MSKLKLQICSDIHLEWNIDKGPNFKWLTPAAPILILAGDISIFGSGTDKYVKFFKKFLDYCSEHWKLIIYVPGNHEFYNERSDQLSIDEINSKIREICRPYDRVRYLQNSSFKLTMSDRLYYFLGTTLWGYIPSAIKFDIETHKNCFYQIYIKDKPMTIESMNKEHEKAIKFLSQGIKKAKKNKAVAIVITHHQPYITPNICYMDMSMDAMNLMHDPVVLWAFGHMHKHTDTHINNIRIVQNGRGYTSNEKTGYVKGFTVQI